jgi:hypothetical protein
MEDLAVLRGGGVDWECEEDLTALSRQDIALRLESLREEGRRARDYTRQVLQDAIDDLILAELVGRGTASLPPEELAQVLLGDAPAPGAPMDAGGTGPARGLL